MRLLSFLCVLAIASYVSAVTFTQPIAVAVNDPDSNYALFLSSNTPSTMYLVDFSTSTNGVTQVTQSLGEGGPTSAALNPQTGTTSQAVVVTNTRILKVNVNYAPTPPTLTTTGATNIANPGSRNVVVGEYTATTEFSFAVNGDATSPAITLYNTLNTPTNAGSSAFSATEKPVQAGCANGTAEYWLINSATPVLATTTRTSATTVSAPTDIPLTGYTQPYACFATANGIVYIVTKTTAANVLRVNVGTATVTALAVGTNLKFIEYKSGTAELLVTGDQTSATVSLATFTVTATATHGVTNPTAAIAVGAGVVTVSADGTTSAYAALVAAPVTTGGAVACSHADCATCVADVPAQCSWCAEAAGPSCKSPNSICTAGLSNRCTGRTVSPKKKSNVGLGVGLFFFFLILISAAVVAGYFWHKKQQQKDAGMGLKDPYQSEYDGPTYSGGSRTIYQGAAPAAAATSAAAPAAYQRNARAEPQQQYQQKQQEAEPEEVEVSAPAAPVSADASVVGYANPFFLVQDQPMAEDGFKTPALVSEAVAWMLNRGTNAEGVFRIPGNLNHMKELKARFDRGERNLLESERDEHDVAGLLKLHFRELSQPTYPRDGYSRLNQAVEMTDSRTRVAAMRACLTTLTPERFALVGSLVGMMAEVARNHKVNKMTAINLAKVFGPSFFMGLPVGAATNIFAVWIKDYDAIFVAEDYPQFD